jgi:hypothetical protein
VNWGDAEHVDEALEVGGVVLDGAVGYVPLAHIRGGIAPTVGDGPMIL